MFALNVIHFLAAAVIWCLIGAFVLSWWAERFDCEVEREFDDEHPPEKLL